MAKKIEALTFQDIVLGADAETIQQALEARREIDQLLAEREQAYRRIAELEGEVERLMGEDSAPFPFPEPPLPVAAVSGKATPAKKAATKSAKPQSSASKSATPPSPGASPAPKPASSEAPDSEA
ncbi:MAG: hypothetical protein ACFB21_06995 [Opitutales bacterium]